MAGLREHAGVQLRFMACGCPIDQGNECQWYSSGCGRCEGCLIIPEDGMPSHFLQAKCRMLTGFNRFRFGTYILAYPRDLTTKDAPSFSYSVWYREMYWFRVVVGVVLVNLRKEAAAFERVLQRISNAAMRIEDGRAQEIISATGDHGDLHAGVYVDVDLVHGNSNQEQRVQVDVVAPIIRKRLVEANAQLAKFLTAENAVIKVFREQMGFHITRVARGYLGRRQFRQEAERQLHYAAAVVIQTGWRGFRTRKYVYAVLLHQRRTRCANKIQATWRSFWVRKPFIHRRDARRYYQKSLAATKFQACWRGVADRKKCRHIRLEREKMTDRIVPAAYSLLATPTAVLAAFESHPSTAIYTRETAWTDDLLMSPLEVFPAIKLDSIIAELHSALPHMTEMLVRQATAAVLSRASRIGYGKRSAHRAVGTANMRRRFNKQQLAQYYHDTDARAGTATSGKIIKQTSRPSTSAAAWRATGSTPTPTKHSALGIRGSEPRERSMTGVARTDITLTDHHADGGPHEEQSCIPSQMTASIQRPPRTIRPALNADNRFSASLVAFAMKSVGVSSEFSKQLCLPVKHDPKEVALQAQQQRLKSRGQRRNSAKSRPSSAISKSGSACGSLGSHPASASQTLRRLSHPTHVTDASVNLHEMHAGHSLQNTAAATPAPAEIAMDEADRLADLGLIPYFPPINPFCDLEALPNGIPLPHLQYQQTDKYIQCVCWASGLQVTDFLTIHEIEELRARKLHLSRGTEALEEASALITAAGITDSLTDVVANFLQHYLVTHEFEFQE